MKIEATSHILNLATAPPVIFLFGLTGAGKNFVGDLLAQSSGRYVYHADEDLTAEMKQAIVNKSGFTEEMRDSFFTIVASRINELLGVHGSLIVTQATYKKKHREYLRAHVAGIDFILIQARNELINQRLECRGGQITPTFADEMRKNFEEPDALCKVITNNLGKVEVIQQAQALYFVP